MVDNGDGFNEGSADQVWKTEIAKHKVHLSKKNIEKLKDTKQSGCIRNKYYNKLFI